MEHLVQCVREGKSDSFSQFLKDNESEITRILSEAIILPINNINIRVFERVYNFGLGGTQLQNEEVTYRIRVLQTLLLNKREDLTRFIPLDKYNVYHIAVNPGCPPTIARYCLSVGRINNYYQLFHTLKDEYIQRWMDIGMDFEHFTQNPCYHTSVLHNAIRNHRFYGLTISLLVDVIRRCSPRLLNIKIGKISPLGWVCSRMKQLSNDPGKYVPLISAILDGGACLDELSCRHCEEQLIRCKKVSIDDVFLILEKLVEVSTNIKQMILRLFNKKATDLRCDILRFLLLRKYRKLPYTISYVFNTRYMKVFLDCGIPVNIGVSTDYERPLWTPDSHTSITSDHERDMILTMMLIWVDNTVESKYLLLAKEILYQIFFFVVDTKHLIYNC